MPIRVIKETYKCGVRSCQRRGTSEDGIKLVNGVYRCEDHAQVPPKSPKKYNLTAPTPPEKEKEPETPIQQEEREPPRSESGVHIPPDLFVRLLREAHAIADDLRRENQQLRHEIEQFREAKLNLHRFVAEIAAKLA